jgi:hypothetical protein
MPFGGMGMDIWVAWAPWCSWVGEQGHTRRGEQGLQARAQEDQQSCRTTRRVVGAGQALSAVAASTCLTLKLAAGVNVESLVTSTYTPLTCIHLITRAVQVMMMTMVTADALPLKL